MKRYIPLLAFLAVLVVPGFAHASPVEVLSSSYHAWGYIYTGAGTKGYDQFGDAPISARVDYDTYGPTLDPSGLYHWYASSSTGEFFTHVEGYGSGNVYAAASWTFQPLADNVSLGIHGVNGAGNWWGGSAFVTDLTTGSSLYQASFDPPQCCLGGGGFDSPLLALDDTHRYAVSLFSTVNIGGDNQRFNLQANFSDPSASVPEPSSMLFLTLAFAGFLTWRSRRYFSNGLSGYPLCTMHLSNLDRAS